MDFYRKFIDEKARHKRALLGSTFFPRTPVLFLDPSKCKKISEYRDLIVGLTQLHVVIFAVSPKQNKILPQANNLHWLDWRISDKEKKEIMKAADLVVKFDSDIKTVLHLGCVPIAQLDGDSTVDYNPLAEKGNGFYFKNATKWEIFASLIRALETYKFPFDWENLIREIIKN